MLLLHLVYLSMLSDEQILLGNQVLADKEGTVSDVVTYIYMRYFHIQSSWYYRRRYLSSQHLEL